MSASYGGRIIYLHITLFPLCQNYLITENSYTKKFKLFESMKKFLIETFPSSSLNMLKGRTANVVLGTASVS